MRQAIGVGGGPVTFDTGRQFWGGSTGRWAGEQLMRALKAAGNDFRLLEKAFSPSALRTLDTLSKDEWKAFDTAIVQEASIRLVGVSDLISAGLTISLPNAMAKTVLEYEKMTDMQPATVSMDGMTRAENDRMEVSLSGLPIPIIHKDWFLSLRTLLASRIKGEGLDVTQARTSGRLVAEEVERMLYRGGKTFGGLPIYGYTTHPNRNTVSFGTNGSWAAAAKTGENMLADLFSMIALAEGDRMYGPYWVYVSRNISPKIEGDFKTNSDKSIRQRLMEVSGITAVKAVDQLPADTVILVQATSDVVVMVDGEPFQTVQWDVQGGFGINFKAFAIQIPLVRADSQGRSGVVHMS